MLLTRQLTPKHQVSNEQFSLTTYFRTHPDISLTAIKFPDTFKFFWTSGHLVVINTTQNDKTIDTLTNAFTSKIFHQEPWVLMPP